MKKTILWSGIAIIILAVAFFWLNSYIYQAKQAKVDRIDSFEACAAAGYPVMESYPEQCLTPDGRNFVRNIDEPALSIDQPGGDNPPSPSQALPDWGTNYMSLSDWRLEATDSLTPLVCQVSDQSSSLNERIALREVNGTKYCIKAKSEGAAGSVYTTYTYAANVRQKMISLSFVARYPNCSNYDEPQQSACTGERQSFNLDQAVDQEIRRAGLK